MKRFLLLLLTMCALPSFAAAGSQTYSTPGTYTFVVPSYGTITVQVWGGGGGGGANIPGGTGGASSFGSVVAGGGVGGQWQTSGGAGGSASGGDVNTAGNRGGNGGWYAGYGAYPGYTYGTAVGGSSPNGGAGGAVGSPAQPGVQPGGGGGGGNSYALSYFGATYAHTQGGGAGGYSQKTYSLGALTVGTTITVQVGGGGAGTPYQNLQNQGYGWIYYGSGNGAPGRVSISWTDPNIAPTTPAITGPSSLLLNTAGTFSFQSTDANGDTLRYAIDWDNNGTVDEYVPSSGYVSSGTSRSVTHSWSTAGAKTFQARSQDSQGASSAWVSKSVTITNPAPTVLLTASDTVYVPTGNPVILTWSSNDATSCTASNFTIPQTESETPTRVYLTSGTSWIVPSDWNNANNTIEVIGGGGGGAGGSGGNGYGSTGGGGGGYSKTTNVSLTSGASVSYTVGAGGAANTEGGDTYFCNSSSNCASISGAAVVAGAKRGSAGVITNTACGAIGTQPAGGTAASGVGSVKYSGGAGGTNTSHLAGGGGGAAGPLGSGARGGTIQNPCGAPYGIGGGGGGGNGGGTAGSLSSTGGWGGDGGNNASGTGKGSSSSGSAIPGSAGTNGGGGGGGPLTTPAIGGAGGAGTEWDSTHGSGGGGGGGGGNNVSGSTGGSGGLYGGGGGGGGTGSTGGSGRQGIIVITYYPFVTASSTSGTASVTPADTTTYIVTCTGPGGSTSDSVTVEKACAPVNMCSGQNVTNSCTGAVVQSCSYQCSMGACVAPPAPGFSSFSATDGNGIAFTASGHLQARPSLVRPGDTARLYWNVSNVSSCTTTGTDGDSWIGGASGTGGKTTLPISQQTSYTLQCTGLDASTITETATVHVTPVFREL